MRSTLHPHALHAVFSAVRLLGCGNAALYALHRLLDRLSGGRCGVQRYLFLAQPLKHAAPARARGAGIDIRPLDPQAPAGGWPRPPDVIEARWRQGAQGLGAWRGGQLVGFLWYAFHSWQEDEVRACYRLASPLAVWDFDVWVCPEQRLGPAFQRLWDGARTRLREQAVCWTCSRISAYNPTSLRAHVRLGARRLGSAVFIRCGPWQWMLSGLAPYCHWSRGDHSFPTFVFDTSPLPHHPPQEP
ncbi:hypothetical protein ACLB1G_00210 [Oxalobacteraceae bacterium A2-2]